MQSPSSCVLSVADSLPVLGLGPRLAIVTVIAPDLTILEVSDAAKCAMLMTWLIALSRQPTVRVHIVYPGSFEEDQTFRKRYSLFSRNFTEHMVAWENLTSVAFPDIATGGILTYNGQHA
ncbi:hypothetical protein SAMD00023353_1700100 [Rosellinia necatrix]|uniref:Uncharacterized protein n=1 Tax=Rosellinia necatrix TaxID=77044 RepID=A0A1S8A796_ROSNE|nr:hypothetical protein SAMD00023353_1700100 [Rosellinia necatrix]